MNSSQQILLLGMLASAFMAATPSSKAQQQVMDTQRTPGATLTVDGKQIPPRPPLRAGELGGLKQVSPQKEPWKFMLSAPGWFVGISGNLGPQHAPTRLDIAPDRVLRNLDMGASFSAEARKGRFGIYGDFFYLSDSDGIGGIGVNGLLSKVDMRGDEYIADLELNPRILEGRNGWLAVRAGVRYMNAYDRLTLHPNQVGINRVSALLTVAPSSLVSPGLNQLIKRESSALAIPPPTEEQKQDLLNSILAAKNDPELAAAVESGEPDRIASALARVQKRIARTLNHRLDQVSSLSANWFDPYVGLAARYNFSKAFYVTAKGDIGGFGAGSKLTSQDYAGLGCQISRNVFTEIGYRYLFVDYQQNGFVLDVAEQGAQITVGIKF